MKKSGIISIVIGSIAVVGIAVGIALPVSFNAHKDNVEKNIEVITSENTTETINDNSVVVSESVIAEVTDTKAATQNGESVATSEKIEATAATEEEVVDEGALESDAKVEQESIAYNGDSTGDGLSLLGSYQGLTYYSQADSRWASVMYSSIGDASQTMKSSACGPTSAAMVVSSSKGAILPTTMASLSTANGYRTANSGTAWAFYPFVADYFDFNEYYYTCNVNTMLSYLTQKRSDGSNKYYVIASCGSGLFTTGGHYIVLVADNNGTISVYDPYLYVGKFNTASRRVAGVVVSGTSAYVSESAFKTYANAKGFWIYSNDSAEGGSTNSASAQGTTSEAAAVNYTRYVSTSSANLNVRDSANGNVINSLRKGTEVQVSAVLGGWSKITSPVNGWVSSQYLSAASVVTSNTSAQYNVKVTASSLRIRKGAGTKYAQVGNYGKGTIVTILSTSGNWGKTAKGWICLSYTSKTTSSVAKTVTATITTTGKYYYLKSATILNSKGSFNGKSYKYLSGTKIKVISHYNSSVDYVYVVKTGRYAYCKVSAYK